MALYHYYLMPSIEEVNREIQKIKEITTVSYSYSMEGVSFNKMKEMGVKLVRKIKELISRFFSKMITGLKSGYHALLGYINKEEKKVELTITHLTNEDRLRMYKRASRQMTTRTQLIFNKNKKLLDLDYFNKKMDDMVKMIKSGDIDRIKQDNELNVSCVIEQKNYGKLCHQLELPFDSFVDGELDDYQIDLSKADNLVTKEIFRVLSREINSNKLPKQIEMLDSEANGLNSELDKIDDVESKYRIGKSICRLYSIQEVLQAKLFTYLGIIGFIRNIYRLIKKGDVWTEPYDQNQKLIHLSFDDNLPTILAPRYNDNQPEVFERQMIDQMFPPRISFAPDIEHAVYGIPMKINNHIVRERIRDNSIEIFVYEGLPDDTTRRIKEKYAKKNISEWNYTAEIPITTSIEIQKTRKVKIHLSEDIVDIQSIYGYRKNWTREVLKIETIEKY